VRIFFSDVGAVYFKRYFGSDVRRAQGKQTGTQFFQLKSRQQTRCAAAYVHGRPGFYFVQFFFFRGFGAQGGRAGGQ